MLQPQHNMFPQQNSSPPQQSPQAEQQLQSQQPTQLPHHIQHHPPPIYNGHNHSSSTSAATPQYETNSYLRHDQHQRYQFLQQQQLQQQKLHFQQQSQQQQQQQQQQPSSSQQYANPMMSSLSSWNPQNTSSISHPSEPALQRLGMNRKYSNHMQRLPSISSISVSSPISSTLSPNGATTFMNNDTSNSNNNSNNTNNNINIDTNSVSSSTSQYSLLNGSSESSPEKSIFKNYWGFNNPDNPDNSLPPANSNSSNNNTNSNSTNNNNIPQQHLPPSYNQIRMHSISEIPQYSNTTNNNNYYNNSPNRSRQPPSIRPQNLKLTALSSSAGSSNPPSPSINLFNSNSRSKSLATSASTNTRSRYSVNLPTTHEVAQQQQQEYNDVNLNDASADGGNDQYGNLESQQHQRKLSLFPTANGGIPNNQQQQHQQQRYHRLSQYDISRFSNNNKISESQQQQVIPPLRAEGPVLANANNNNTDHYQPPRRESVAAVYHHQNNNNNINDRNTFQMTSQLEANGNGLGYANISAFDELRGYYGDNNMTDSNANNNNAQYNEIQGYNNGNQDINMLENNSYEASHTSNSSESNNKNQNSINSMNNSYVRIPKFTKINSMHDLRPNVNSKPKFRRASSTHTFISPMLALTTKLNLSYSMCVPEYDYQKSKNPRRVLTKNNKPFHNGGSDNESYDYILYVNDILGTEENKKYLVLDILGQGTFGQVVKCQNLKTQEIVAVKVVKARQECLQQSIAEGNVIEFLNKKVDPKFQKYFINLKDKFMHKYHLCLVFELLSSNLYELIKQNHHHGLCIKLVRNFSTQILDALCALKDIKIIHCDLKPENILLSKLNKPDLKIIDFGSACEEHQTLYSYVQSRFYRSPEVILGVGYSTSVDMWSFGCIVAELFLGLPLLPGASEYEQLVRMIQIFGMPPSWMMVDKKAGNYIIKSENDDNNSKTGIRYSYRLKTLDEFNRDFGLQEEPAKQYFCDTNLNDIIMKYRLPKKNMNQEMIDKEMHERSCLVHFLNGVLNISPLERWTPQEAIQHPFITGESWSGKWIPPTLGFGSFAKNRLNSLV